MASGSCSKQQRQVQPDGRLTPQCRAASPCLPLSSSVSAFLQCRPAGAAERLLMLQRFALTELHKHHLIHVNCFELRTHILINMSTVHTDAHPRSFWNNVRADLDSICSTTNMLVADSVAVASA